jgi:hypothetical protein
VMCQLKKPLTHQESEMGLAAVPHNKTLRKSVAGRRDTKFQHGLGILQGV